jgi:isoleucyl-tRNA synthetase
MYTFAPTSHARRSAQTVLWQITEALVRLVAPILSFTADEVWEYLPKVEGREASVHLAQFPAPSEIFSEDPAPLLEEWRQLFAVRDAVLIKLEVERKEKRIGKALEADVKIIAGPAYYRLLVKFEHCLKELLNVSNVYVDQLTPAQGHFQVYPDLTIEVTPATGHKCARCWNFMPEVSNYGI